MSPHDLATLSEVCGRIAIMYAGEIVEIGAASAVLETPRPPYTRRCRFRARLDLPDPDAIRKAVSTALPAAVAGSRHAARMPTPLAMRTASFWKQSRPIMRCLPPLVRSS